MKYLAINTAGSFVEIAAVNGERSCYLYDAEHKKASEAMMTMIDGALLNAGLTLNETEFIACCIGPGSFTGIRIGVTTARAFAHALKKNITAFTSLDVLAYNVSGDLRKILVCAADAGNGFVYLNTYEKGIARGNPLCLDASGAQQYASKNGETIVCDANIKHVFPSAAVAAPDKNALMSAAENAYKSTGVKDFSQIEPLYIRQPQAVESLNSQNTAKQ